MTPAPSEIGHLPWLRRHFPWGVGWYQRTDTDCLRAALATATQTRYEEVPHLTKLPDALAWLEENGWDAEPHFDTPPVDRGNWIGVTAVVSDDMRHTLCMTFDRLRFDPASGWEFPGGLSAPTPSEIEYAISIQPQESP